MSLLSYWPTHEEIDRCIKSEAESVADEVLLAVHQEFPLAYATVGPDGKVVPDSRQVASEDDLMRHLLGSAPEGSLVVPITGASGVGKSHLIRMLDARLRRHPKASRYLVIRIPKSASLRRVVELILDAEPLQHPKYSAVRAEFDKALADVPLTQAVILFQAQLRIALGDYATKLRHQLQQAPTDENLKRRLHVAMWLPAFLSDAATENYFHQQVLPRIIHRSVEGLKDPNAPIDPADSQFKPSDFDLPDEVEIASAAIPVQKFYQLTLNTQAGQGKAIAADVLNQVVDQATRQLYQLNESLGGKTLGDVIGDIRRLLLAEDPTKELIILVEDFAALVGIQDTLAKILIQHGETDGTKTHATIRSVIAVTDGYLAGRDTLATRAGREWIVESRFESEAEVLSRTKRLVAFYLNAARHGEDALKAFYRDASNATAHSNKPKAVEIYSDGSGEHESLLEAFGTIKNVPLFPFTESAIECLARSTLTAGNTLVFNPRFVIKNVIREVLINGRDAYLAGQFPPPNLSGTPPAYAVAQWLGEQKFSPDVRSRYERFVSVWGNQPTTLSDIACIPGAVFEAFKLAPPQIESEKQDIQKVSQQTSTDGHLPPPPPPPQPDSPQIKQASAYQTALENWVQSEVMLEQKVANAIRQAIASLLNQRIDWNAEFLQKQEVKFTLFSLPNAMGEGRVDNDPIKVTESTVDPDGRLRGELFALLRYVSIYKESLDYDDSDEDLARVGNLIDRLQPAVMERFRASAKKQTQAAIALLATNSRLLGLMEKGRTPTAVSSFLFGDVVPPPDLIDSAPPVFKDWRQLQRDALQIRPMLIDLVLETSGCFQGKRGDTPQGVDIVGLIESYPDESLAPDRLDLPPQHNGLQAKLLGMRAVAINARLKQVLQAAKTLETKIANELGTDFDKQAVIEAVKQLATDLKDMGAWPTDTLGFSSNEFLTLCETFRNAAVKEALTTLSDVLADGVQASNVASRTISRVAQMPLVPLLTAEQFINRAGQVVRVAEGHVRTMEAKYEGVTPAQTAEALAETFESLATDLARLQ
ncbi:MAG: hypothetical protein F9K30_08250 [Dechloromonas sp.]|nr:MAG: hypothetical protein F9K30_08250 [Dechloromonas sp.]